MKKRVKTCGAFGVVAIALLLLFFLSINIGSLKVSFSDLLRGLFVEYNETVATIYDLRFPRIVLSMCAGAAIAVSGVLLQAVLKNPLADAGMLGISSGANFLSVLMLFLVPQWMNAVPVFTILGGLLTYALVYFLSFRGGSSPLRMILVGVAVQSMFSGLLQAVETIGGSGTQSSIASMVEGNLTMKTWSDVHLLWPYVLVGLLLACCVSGVCNVFGLDEQTAKSLGVSVQMMRFLISMLAVILVSISTAVVGVVSFLGLLVPHIGRRLVGSDHRKLIPFSMLLGALLFLLADTVGRSICPPYEISAAMLFCVIGGPYFIFLLRKGCVHVGESR